MDTDFILALARAAVEQPEPEPEPEQQLDERSLTLRLTLSPSRVVVCEQDRAVGIGGVAWQASVALSHAMGHDKQLFPSWAGQRVLELGCGTALCGLSAWALGAGDVVLTDAAQCGPVVQRSINATRVSAADDEPVGAITYAALRWGDPVPEAAAREFDVVVGSDLTYDTDDHQKLLRTLVDVCQLNAHTRVVLAHQQRALSETADPLSSFIGSAKALGFLVTTPVELRAPPPEDCEGHDVHTIASPVVGFIMTMEGVEGRNVAKGDHL